ncbi:hypothetical protein [Streptomyces sp. NPDC059874]
MSIPRTARLRRALKDAGKSAGAEVTDQVPSASEPGGQGSCDLLEWVA